MTVQLIYPYATAPEAIALKSVQVSPASLVLREGNVDATDEAIDEAGFRLECVVDPTLLADILPEGGDPGTDLQLCLRISSVDSRRRSLERAPVGATSHEFCVSLSRLDHFGEVSLEPLLILSNNLIPQTGRAHAKGSVVGWGPTISVEFDAKQPPPGRSIPIEWVKFADDPTLDDELLHTLAVTGDPKILLNSGIADAHPILSSRGTHGAKARIRDVEFHKIALQVWTALLAQSLLELRRAVGENDVPLDEALAELVEWQANVVRDWAPHLYPESSAHDALEELLQSIDDNDPHLLGTRVGTAIQKRLNTLSSFKGLVRDQSAFQSEVDRR